jgi:hypothetical protein
VRSRLLGPNQQHTIVALTSVSIAHSRNVAAPPASAISTVTRKAPPRLGEIPVYSAPKKMPCPRDTASFREGEPGDSRSCVNRCSGIVGRGAVRKSATAHDRDHHFNAAVRTGWSQSAVVSVSSRLTVSEHPAMSSEVTKLPTSERLMRKPRFSSMRRAALYIK